MQEKLFVENRSIGKLGFYTKAANLCWQKFSSLAYLLRVKSHRYRLIIFQTTWFVMNKEIQKGFYDKNLSSNLSLTSKQKLWTTPTDNFLL